MKRTPRLSAASIFTAASRRPRPAPRIAAAAMSTGHVSASAKSASPPAASTVGTSSNAIVPNRSRTKPDRPLEPNCVTVIAASSTPRPASGASSAVRMDGHAMPSMPVGRPRTTNPLNAIAAVRIRIARH